MMTSPAQSNPTKDDAEQRDTSAPAEGTETPDAAWRISRYEALRRKIPRAWPRLRLRFSLKTLLLVMTLGVVMLGLWRLYLTPLRMQDVAAEDFRQAGGTIRVEADQAAWLHRLVGAEPQKIVYADLRDCELTERTLDHVRWLYGVRTLYVSGREVTDNHLRAITRLSSLHELGLDSTSVTHDGLEQFSQAAPNVQVTLSDVRRIDEFEFLAGVSVDDKSGVNSEPPTILIGLTCYGDDFDNTRLAELDLPTCLALRRLSIHALSVTDDGLSFLSMMDVLTHLDLCRSGVTDGCMRYVNQIKHLQRLKLTATRITSAGLADLSDLSSLTALDVSWTSVDDLAPLAKMTSLKTLNLSNCPFDVDELTHISGLVELETLHLFDVPVSDEALRHLSDLHSLRELSLVGASLTDQGLEHLYGLENLRVLLLTGDVTDEAVARLRRALPGLETIVQGTLPDTSAAPTPIDTDPVPSQHRK
ncbi:MAG: hypothetical protein IID44_09380 [Planctomycetes bacterium]|nr:hypothetical protein [Planctomycetota bacterium]